MPSTRSLVEKALIEFQGQADFRLAATKLLGALGYESTRTVRLNPANAAGFVKQFNLAADEFDQAKAHTGEWAQFEFLFQFGDGEVKRGAAGNAAVELFNQAAERGNKNSFFFHAVKLTGSQYRRGVLADITRQLNRPFALPTVVLFQHGDGLSLGVIGRRANKKDATRDVLEKVTLIKDINLAHPHPAHVRILDELRLSEQIRTNKATGPCSHSGPVAYSATSRPTSFSWAGTAKSCGLCSPPLPAFRTCSTLATRPCSMPLLTPPLFSRANKYLTKPTACRLSYGSRVRK